VLDSHFFWVTLRLIFTPLRWAGGVKKQKRKNLHAVGSDHDTQPSSKMDPIWVFWREKLAGGTNEAPGPPVSERRRSSDPDSSVVCRRASGRSGWSALLRSWRRPERRGAGVCVGDEEEEGGGPMTSWLIRGSAPPPVMLSRSLARPRGEALRGGTRVAAHFFF